MFLFLVFFAQSASSQTSNALPLLSPAYPEIPPTFWEQEGTIVLVVGLTLIALAVLILWKRFQPKPAVILPPEILAREALAKLPRQPEDGKHLSEVSQILRRYVITAFELSPGEFTTAEFSAALAGSEKIGAELAQTISDFMRECDERKFSPTNSDTPVNAANRALQIINLAEEQRQKSEGAEHD